MENSRKASFAATITGYPKSVYFILTNELFERFSFYGMRAILTLYFINEHGFKESTAFFFYHMFVSFAYFTPLLGSILADNYWGRFKVIALGSIIYVVGLVSLTIGSVPHLDMSIRSALDLGGLFLIALATGGIKPCVASFAADQFEESRKDDRAQFFSFFYFAINLGALCSMFLTPVLRGRVQCFGSDYCFPLAFGVPALFMIFATVVFFVGTRFYTIRPVNYENFIGRSFRCIVEAAYAKFNNSEVSDPQMKVNRKDWLDYAPSKYSYSLVAAVRSFLKVLVILLPLPLYHALADQQGSTWVVQARGMNGNIGGYFTLLPDQMNFLNSAFVLVAILVYESAIFPVLQKLCKITPLRRMSVGGLIAGASYIIAGVLQLQVNKTAAPVPQSGHTFLFRTGNSTSRLWSSNGPYLMASGQNEWPSVYGEMIAATGQEFNLTLDSGAAYIIEVYGGDQHTRINAFRYNSTKPPNGKTRIYLSLDPLSPLVGHSLFVLNSKGKTVQETLIKPGVFLDILPANFDSNIYRIAYGPNCHGINCPFQIDFVSQMGAVHLLELTDNYSMHLRRQNELKTLVPANSISILWQLPQIIVLSFGEVLLCVTVLEFVYSQAPPSMKSVLQAAWLLTSFFGNLIAMFISGLNLFKEPATEMLFYAFLMFANMFLFIYLAIQYKYVDPKEFEVGEDDDRSKVKWTLDSVANEDNDSLKNERRID